MPKRTGRPWSRRKAQIIRRDEGICHLCFRPGADTADHIIPWSVSKDDRPSNLKAAHQVCNRIRGDRDIAVARAEILKTLTPAGGWDW